MSIYAIPGDTFEAGLANAPTGLAGTLGVQIIDTPAGTVISPRTTAGISEQPAGSGYYTTTLTAPATEGTYSVFWDTGTITPDTTAAEELIVAAYVQAPTTPPPAPTPSPTPDEDYGRTFAGLVQEVLDIGFSPERYREKVKGWINEAIHKISRKVRLPSREAVYGFTTVVNQTSYALPPDLVVIRSLWAPASHAPLDAVSVHAIDYSSGAKGTPMVFALEGKNIVLYPTPSREYALELRYRSNSLHLTQDEERPPFPDEYAGALVSYAASKAHRAEDDYEAAAVFMADYDRQVGELSSDLQSRDRSPKQVPGMMLGVGSGPRFRRPG